MKKVEAVIFDMDGVIFDSERAYMNCWFEISDKYNIQITEEIYKKCIGVTGEVRNQTLQIIYGKTFPVLEFVKDFQHLYDLKYKNGGLPLKKGVVEILTFLKNNNIKIGLASSTYSKTVINLLQKANIYSFFNQVITGDMVKKGKPDPEIYNLVCSKLNVNPNNACSVEDSYSGITSAYLAGLYTIMVPDMLPPTTQSKNITKKIFNSLLDVIDYLKQEIVV